MKDVRLLKVTEDEVQVLQSELYRYSELQRLGIHHWGNEEFYTALVTIDIAFRLWVTFRRKIESAQNSFTVRLKVSEAVVVLKCCYWNRDGRNDYEKHVAEKYKNLIDQQLKSIV